MPPAARKSTARKATAKKTTAKKATAQKGTAKKAAAGKATAKKAAPTKAATRKASAASTAYASAQSAASTAAASAQAGVEDAVLRVRELQGQLLESARRGGTHYLQAYEKNLSSMLELTENAAESTQLSWAVTLANNYADFVKRVNDAVMKAGRQALG